MSKQDESDPGGGVSAMIVAIIIAIVFASLVLFLGCATSSAEGATNTKRESVLATGFADKGDKWAGDVFICLHRRGRWKPIDAVTPGIAHRTRKCGSKVLVRNRRTKKTVWTRVIDRGPYWLVPVACATDTTDRGGFRHASHACWRKGRPATRHERRKGPAHGYVWANGADLTPPIRRAIGHNGLEPVDLEW